jgi:SNF2 family DNA or RNA helicase
MEKEQLNMADCRLMSPRAATGIEISEEVRRSWPNEKIVVRANTLRFIALLSCLPRRRDPKIEGLFFDGNTKVDARAMALHRFLTGPAGNPLFITPEAGSEGLNIACASKVIIFEPLWKPLTEILDGARR